MCWAKVGESDGTSCCFKPVDRCLHTSQLLVEAAGWDIEILETKILGDQVRLLLIRYYCLLTMRIFCFR